MLLQKLRELNLAKIVKHNGLSSVSRGWATPFSAFVVLYLPINETDDILYYFYYYFSLNKHGQFNEILAMILLYCNWGQPLFHLPIIKNYKSFDRFGRNKPVPTEYLKQINQKKGWNFSFQISSPGGNLMKKSYYSNWTLK